MRPHDLKAVCAGHTDIGDQDAVNVTRDPFKGVVGISGRNDRLPAQLQPLGSVIPGDPVHRRRERHTGLIHLAYSAAMGFASGDRQTDLELRAARLEHWPISVPEKSWTIL
jgi:hypothetical protein